MNELVPRESNDVRPPNPALVYLASLTSDASRRTMGRALDQIARWLSDDVYDAHEFSWATLSYEWTAMLRAALTERYAPATANKMLSAVRGVLRAAYRLGLMTHDEYRRASDIENVSGSTLASGRDVSPGEVAALLAACFDDPTPKGRRDAALLALLYQGLRRSEIVALTIDDYDANDRRLIVRGKGRKQRVVYLDEGSAAALESWLADRGYDKGGLLVPFAPGGDLRVDDHLTPQTIYDVVRQRAHEAGIGALSPHDFRRTAVGELLDRGVDIVTVSKIMGHADPKTTARYDRRDDRTKAAAARRRYFPYRRPG